MNFAAGMMIFHAAPNIAFALFVKLLEDFDLRPNYLPGLPGLIEKCEEINQRFATHVPRAHRVLEQSGGIQAEMHSMEIVMGLFGSMMPMDSLTMFYDQFMREGWEAFFRVLIRFYRSIEDQIMTLEDPLDVIELVKT